MAQLRLLGILDDQRARCVYVRHEWGVRTDEMMHYHLVCERCGRPYYRCRCGHESSIPYDFWLDPGEIETRARAKLMECLGKGIPGQDPQERSTGS